MNGRVRRFAGRTAKEMLRDPVSYIFSLGVPIFMLVLYRAIHAAVGEAMDGGTNFYALESFSSGAAVFSFAFSMLNVTLLLSKDRAGALLRRLCTSPLKPSEIMAGYALPTAVIAVGQAVICFGTSFILGMRVPAGNFLLCLVMLIPSMFLYIAFGLLYGSLLNDKSAPPIASMTATVSSIISGAWFDVALFGESTNTVFHILPFANAVDCAKAAMLGNYGDILKPLIIVVAWTAALLVLSYFILKHSMKKDND